MIMKFHENVKQKCERTTKETCKKLWGEGWGCVPMEWSLIQIEDVRTFYLLQHILPYGIFLNLRILSHFRLKKSDKKIDKTLKYFALYQVFIYIFSGKRS